MFDCIIVGAGPAGGAAAYHLAKGGRSVLVLEKEVFPRYKPCCGGVSPQVAQWFDFDFAPAISSTVDAIRFTWKLGDPVDVGIETAEPMWMVRRDVFDAFLMKQAQGAGAELRDGTAVTGIQFQGDHWQVQTAAGPVEGRYLIAADGAKGPMADWLGFKGRKTRQAMTLEAQTGAPEARAAFEFGLVKNGSLWNFPKADGYSIGVSTFRGNDDENFAPALSQYAQHFGINAQQAEQQVHPLALWDGNQTLHTQQALLAGEAASLVDPFTAEGIRPAMFSGVKAAEAIAQALDGNAGALANYTAQIHDRWGSDMVWAQRLAGVFYRVPQMGYKAGIKRPSATTRMAQILVGELRYADIANRALKRLSTGLIPGFGR